jgi:DNA-binding transcriptional LysR family regulator
MELRHLRYFVAVAEEGTFVRAAERLHLAQPALSRQIRDLEREVGVELLERGPRAVRLAPAGEASLRGAREVLRDTELAIDRARRTSRGRAGRCSVCAGKLPTWNGFTGHLATRMQRDYPLVELVISEGALERQWDAIRDGTADLGLGGRPPASYAELSFQTLGAEVFDGALLPATHPAAREASIPLRVVADETLLVISTRVASDCRTLLRQIAHERNAHARVREMETIAEATAYVAAGAGWTPFPVRLAAWAPPGTVVVPLSDFRYAFSYGVVWRTDEERAVTPTVRDVAIALGAGHDAVDDPAADDVDGVDPLVDTVAARSLELRHLRYFVAVAAEGSVTRAASRLGLTQPALSRQVRDLERAVGVSLMTRDGRGVSLTSAGESLLASAREILEAVDRIPAEAHRATRGVARRCVVATIVTPLAGQLAARVVQDAATEMPDVHVLLTELPSPEQPDALAASRVDLGICHAFTAINPLHGVLNRQRLIDDRVNCVLLPATHPLATRTEIDASELGELPFLFIPRAFHPPFYDQVMDALATTGFHPTIDQTYDGLQTAWSLTRQGKGWCLGFESFRRHAPAGLVAVRLRGIDLPWGIDVLWRRDEAGGAVLGVLELIRRVAKGMGDA